MWLALHYLRNNKGDGPRVVEFANMNLQQKKKVELK
jgi:hypothetical protein